MKKSFKRFIATSLAALTIVTIFTNVSYAASFGNSKNGASSVEVLQVRYDGAAWNYKGSGYKNASFKYTRNNRTLLSKTATSGKVTGSVWDDLLDWSKKATTKFTWNRQK